MRKRRLHYEKHPRSPKLKVWPVHQKSKADFFWLKMRSVRNRVISSRCRIIRGSYTRSDAKNIIEMYSPIAEVVPKDGVMGTGTAIDKRFGKDCPWLETALTCGTWTVNVLGDGTGETEWWRDRPANVRLKGTMKRGGDQSVEFSYFYGWIDKWSDWSINTCRGVVMEVVW